MPQLPMDTNRSSKPVSLVLKRYRQMGRGHQQSGGLQRVGPPERVERVADVVGTRKVVTGVVLGLLRILRLFRILQIVAMIVQGGGGDVC